MATSSNGNAKWP
jgi:hypothetical protein